MEFAPKNRLLLVSDEEMWAIRRAVNLTSAESINQDIDAVLEWYRKQQHLPRIQLDRGLIERILVSRKGSVEQTKLKIDLMFTIRSLIPDIASPRDVLHPAIQKQLQFSYWVVLPKLNHDLTRISIFKYSQDTENYNLIDLLKYMVITIEYRLKHDYSTGDRFIVDLQHKSLSHLGKETPSTLKNCELYLLKSYGIRTFGVHYINAPAYVAKFISLFKAAFSEKIGSRMMVHSSLDDLQKHISKDVLPMDYGGAERSLIEIHEDWIKELSQDDVRKYLIEQETLRSDESLRIGGRLDDELLGLPGSFKKISVD